MSGWHPARTAIALAAFCLCLAWLARAAVAQGPGGPSVPPLTHDGPAMSNSDPPTAFARFGSSAAPWVWQIVDARQLQLGARPPSRIAVIDGEGVAYLALEWRLDGSNRVEVHKVTVRGGDAEGELVRVVEEGDRVSISALTGETLFPGEPPVLVLSVGTRHGQCGDWLRLIRLAGDTVDITPDFAALPLRNLIDLDGDGVAEAVAFSTRGETCGAGLDGIPVVLRRAVAGGFRPACGDFPEAFTAWRRDRIGWVPYSVPDLLVEPYRSGIEAVMMAQAGQVDAAAALWDRARLALSAEELAALDGFAWPLQVDDWRQGRRVPLEGVLARARAMPVAACPVSAAVEAIRADWADADFALAQAGDPGPSPADLLRAAERLDGVGRHPRIPNDAPDRPFARFGTDAAPWLPGELERLAIGRDDAGVPYQIALLSGLGGRQYLAIGWEGHRGIVLDIYAVGAPSGDGVALRLLRSVFHDIAVIVEPTGTRPFPDLPPVLAVREASIGSGGEGSLRLILLTGDTVDITPDWAGATLGIRDLDGDGMPELVMEDESFHGFPRYCGSCGPYLPVILRREGGGFAMACTDFRDIYLGLRTRIDPSTAPWVEGLELLDQTERLANRALLSAQAGAFADAFRASDRMVEAAVTWHRERPSQWTEHVPAEARAIADTVVRAHGIDDGTGCPLSEVSRRLEYVPPWRDQ